MTRMVSTEPAIRPAADVLDLDAARAQFAALEVEHAAAAGELYRLCLEGSAEQIAAHLGRARELPDLLWATRVILARAEIAAGTTEIDAAGVVLQAAREQEATVLDERRRAGVTAPDQRWQDVTNAVLNAGDGMETARLHAHSALHRLNDLLREKGLPPAK